MIALIALPAPIHEALDMDYSALDVCILTNRFYDYLDSRWQACVLNAEAVSMA